MRRQYWVFVSVLTAAGCAPRNPTTTRAVAPERHHVESRPSDERRTQRLLAEGSRLISARKTTPMATLIDQLKRKSCRLPLPQSSNTALSGEELYEQSKPSVLIIGAPYICDRCRKRHLATASGFMISDSGACVTNYHVVNEPNRETLIAMTDDGRVVPVQEVLAASRVNDLAILQVDLRGLRPVPLHVDDKPGTPVYVLSHPSSRFYSLTEGIISRYFQVRRAQREETIMMSITADFAGGSSGAPVLNNRGAAVGVVMSTTTIQYHDSGGRTGGLQMVEKECIPAASVLKLIGR